MRVRLPPRASAILLHIVVSTAAVAQQPAANLSGTVVSATTGDPVPFAIVALGPGFPPRFTDQAGHFAFPGVSAGRYHLVARQIGYFPVDTALDVAGDTSPSLRIALHHLAVVLPPITVIAQQTCRSPGPPDPALSPDLAAVFDQLVENAHRLALLNDSFPYDYRLERSQWPADREGRAQAAPQVDTLSWRIEAEWRYEQGHLVRTGRGPTGPETFVFVPGLVQFADSAFTGTHCFWLAGRDSMEGTEFVRLDFAPAASLRATDVAGTVYLDLTTYQMRYAVVRLTHPGRALTDVLSLVATIRFAEVAPSVVLHDRVHVVTSLRSGGWDSPAQRIEEQRLVAVAFRRPLPR